MEALEFFAYNFLHFRVEGDTLLVNEGGIWLPVQSLEGTE